jgi:hypothetical protein
MASCEELCTSAIACALIELVLERLGGDEDQVLVPPRVQRRRRDGGGPEDLVPNLRLLLGADEPSSTALRTKRLARSARSCRGNADARGGGDLGRIGSVCAARLWWRAAFCELFSPLLVTFGSRSGGPKRSLYSLHTWIGFHLIRSLS